MTAERILAVHPGALGDVVLFGRLLASLAGRVKLVARGGKAELLGGLGVADEAADFDALPLHECFGDAPAGPSRLTELLGPCDRLISCFAAGDTRAQARLAEAIGASESVFLPVRPPEEFEGHLLEFWRTQLDGAPTPATHQAAPSQMKSPAWPVPQAWRDEATRALAAAGVSRNQRYVTLHPGAGSGEKCWPLDRFVGLARRLAAGDAPLSPVFVLGPVEADLWPAERRAKPAAEFPVLQDASLPCLAGLLAGAAATVGNDSGPAHLAAAVGAPTLALFGPTDPARFAPLGPAVRILRRQPLAELEISECVGALSELACLQCLRKE